MLEKTISVRGLTFAYCEWEKDNQPIAIALHGWLDNAASFDLMAPKLSKCTLQAYDLPGHGKTAHLPSFGYYHFIDGVSHIVALIKSLKLKKCILIGHSLGACLASIVAGSIPEHIAKLVLIDGLGPLTSEAEHAQKNYQAYLDRFQTLERKPTTYYPRLEDAVEARARKGYLARELTEIIVKRGSEKTEQGYRWRHDDRLLLPSPLRMTEAQVLPFLKAITAPTCLITASEGFDYDKEKMSQRVNAIPNLEHHQVKGGHHIHMEAPNECAEIINQFLSTTPQITES